MYTLEYFTTIVVHEPIQYYYYWVIFFKWCIIFNKFAISVLFCGMTSLSCGLEVGQIMLYSRLLTR